MPTNFFSFSIEIVHNLKGGFVGIGSYGYMIPQVGLHNFLELYILYHFPMLV